MDITISLWMMMSGYIPVLPLLTGDQSNVGFVLMNQRTMETRFYKVEGATEMSAMSSAEGQVQNLGYKSSFPLLFKYCG